MDKRMLQKIVDKAEVTIDDTYYLMNGIPSYYKVPASLIREAKVDYETVVIPKALYDRFMNLFNEVDYQIREHYDNRANLTIERDNVKRMLDKEVRP